MNLFKWTVVLAAALVYSQMGLAQKNLLTNGSFEDDFEGWTEYGGRTTPYVVKEGKNACAIVAGDNSKWLGIHQEVKLPKKAQYMLVSAWYKTDNVVRGKEPWQGALCRMELLDKNDKKVGPEVELWNLEGDNAWTKAQKALIIPAEVVKVKLLFALGFATGTLFIDDAWVKVLTQQEYEALEQ